MMLPTSLDPAALAAFALNVLFQITAICLMALLAARLVFRHDPSLRYYACLACLVSLLLSPIAVSIQQTTGRQGLITVSLPRDLPLSPAPTAPVRTTFKTNSEAETGGRIVSTPQPRLSSTVWALFSAWAAGVVWGTLRLFRGCKEVSRLTRDIRPWDPSAYVAMLNRVEQVLRRPVPPILISPRLKSPVMIGIFRPLVILPEGLPEALTPAQLKQVLLHECAHVAFHHTCGGVVARLTRLLYWPHPLVYALCRELARAREEICDNVASQEDGAACYARTLLALAQGMSAAPNITSTLALLGPGTSLEERIAGLLDPRRNRMVRMKRWKLWAVACGATVALASTAVVRVVSAQENAGSVAAKAAEAAKAEAITQAQAQAREQVEAAEAAVRQAQAAMVRRKAAEAALMQAAALERQTEAELAGRRAAAMAALKQAQALSRQTTANTVSQKAAADAAYQQQLAARQQAEAAYQQAEVTYHQAISVSVRAKALGQQEADEAAVQKAQAELALRKAVEAQTAAGERQAAEKAVSKKAATAAASQQKVAAGRQEVADRLKAEVVYRQALAARQQAEAARQQAQAMQQQTQALAAGLHTQAMQQQAAEVADQRAVADANYQVAIAVYRQAEAARLQAQAMQRQAAAAALQKAKAELDAKQARAIAGHRQVIHSPGESSAELLAAKKQAEAEANKR